MKHLFRLLIAAPIILVAHSFQCRKKDDDYEDCEFSREYTPRGFDIVMSPYHEFVRWAPHRLMSGKPIRAHKGKCVLKLTNKGQLIVKKKVGNRRKTAWKTEKHGKGKYQFRVQRDANLVIYRCNPDGTSCKEPVWSSRSPAHTRGWCFDPPDCEDYLFPVLLFDEECRLVLLNDVGDEGGSMAGFWASVYGPMYESDDGWEIDGFPTPTRVLTRGTMSNNAHAGAEDEADLTLHLQDDCNLVLFKGYDLADKEEVVWSSGTAEQASNCYVYAGTEEIAVYEGNFKKPKCCEDPKNAYASPGKGNKLWSLTNFTYPVVFTRNGIH